MRCSNPRTVGFKADGKTISWSKKTYSKEFATFQLPCSKCIECRLDYARQWAIRCVHEAQMYPKNCFITLTYDNDSLKSFKLEYPDFQKFMKRLRKTQNDPIGMFVTGEYGEETKRPHWHAIIFNWEPTDLEYLYSNERQDKVYTSKTLEKIWGKGHCQVGAVTFESAGYCARYAAKKLVHGNDQDHDFHPISKKSSKHAIGKRWLEQYWQDAFNNGEIILLHPDGTSSRSSIPRYYEKWLKEKQPEAWLKYISKLKIEKMAKAQAKSEKEQNDYELASSTRGPFRELMDTPNQRKNKVLKEKFNNQLQKNLKLK